MLNAVTRNLCPEQMERQLRAGGEDPGGLNAKSALPDLGEGDR